MALSTYTEKKLAQALGNEDTALNMVTEIDSKAPLTGTEVLPFVLATGDGAVTAKSGVVYITAIPAAALTIADPTATTDDGKRLTLISTTAQGHTLNNSAGSGFNATGAAGDVGTFGGAKGDNIVITAYQGVWYVISKVNVTLG